MYTLEGLEKRHGLLSWLEIPQLYHSAQQALEAAASLWEDDDHLYEEIRLKKTVTLCTLKRPGEPESPAAW